MNDQECKNIELYPLSEEKVTPEEFLDLMSKHGNRIPNIESVEILPPRFDKKNDWGGFKLKYKTPIFKYA